MVLWMCENHLNSLLLRIEFTTSSSKELNYFVMHTSHILLTMILTFEKVCTSEWGTFTLKHSTLQDFILQYLCDKLLFVLSVSAWSDWLSNILGRDHRLKVYSDQKCWVSCFSNKCVIGRLINESSAFCNYCIGAFHAVIFCIMGRISTEWSAIAQQLSDQDTR